ncbi:MAG: hypothetical protein PHZ25_00775 [Candidatus Pacebacteria bacterium]|nr:hypothetical protein [Candidatus Paceibacterota bacterium]
MNLKEIGVFLFSKKHFVVFLFLVFLASFSYALIHEIRPAVDAKAYDIIAMNLVENGEYRLGEGELEKNDAILKVGPGYEFFIAAIYFIFGQKYWLVWLIQSLLFVSSIFLVSALAIGLFYKERKVNWRNFYIALVPAAFFIDVIQLNAMIMGETLFIFLTTAAIVVFYFNIQKPSLLKSSGLGFLLGLLYLTRPVALALVAGFLGTVFFKKQYKSFILILSVFLILQIPWIVRNYEVYGKILPTHTAAGGVDFLSGNYPGNHGEYRSDFELYQKIEAEDPTPMGFYENSTKWFLNFAKEEPIKLAGVWLEKSVIFWSMTKTGGFWFHYFNKGEQAATIIMSIISYFLIYGTAIAYAVKLLKDKFKGNDFLKAVFVSTFFLVLISIITIISSRYRLTLLPIMLIFSFGFWAEEKKWKYISLAGVWIVFATFLDLFLQYDKFLDKIGIIVS